MGRGAGKGGREAAPWMTADNKKRLGFTSAERPVSFSLEVMTSHLRKKKKPFLQFFSRFVRAKCRHATVGIAGNSACSARMLDGSCLCELCKLSCARGVPSLPRSLYIRLDGPHQDKCRRKQTHTHTCPATIFDFDLRRRFRSTAPLRTRG